MDTETKIAIRNLWRSQLPMDYFANAIYTAQSGMMMCDKCKKGCKYNKENYTIKCDCGEIPVNDFGAPC